MIILALGACHSPDETFIYDHHLISHLENKFQAEIENMGKHKTIRPMIALTSPLLFKNCMTFPSTPSFYLSCSPHHIFVGHFFFFPLLLCFPNFIFKCVQLNIDPTSSTMYDGRFIQTHKTQISNPPGTWLLEKRKCTLYSLLCLCHEY